MDRRRFLLTSLAGALAAPLAVEAQAPPRAERAYRVGWLAQGGPASGNPLWEHFVRRLSELGYSEGRNLIIESRWAARSEQFPDLAAQLVGLRTDVVVTIGMPATQAVARASQSVPIVMVTGGSAVEFGLIHSLARPGGNVTGVTLEVNPDLIGKRLELLKTAVSGVGHIVYAQDSGYPFAARSIDIVQAAAPRLGLTVLVVDLSAPDEFEGAFATIVRSRAKAILMQGSPFQSIHFARIAELATRAKIPCVGSFRLFADAGALLSYGPSLTDLAVRAVPYVDKVLKGAKPADLPVEQPTTFELVINLKTAKALGLTIPPSLLARADHVIE